MHNCYWSEVRVNSNFVLFTEETLMNNYRHKDNKSGGAVKRSSVFRKLVNMTLLICLTALVISTAVCLTAIYSIRKTTVEDSINLGKDAARISETALIAELESKLTQAAQDKANLAESKFSEYISSIKYAACYAEALLAAPQNYAKRECMYPDTENGGTWTMQRVLADKSVQYEDVKNENSLLGNMEDVFSPIIRNNSNISTIYIGTEDGLLINYDPISDVVATGGEAYYEYRESKWYNLAKEKNDCVFTEAYQDVFGRGLTITCVSPVFYPDGEFFGCVAMDILVDDLNRSMVSDGIVEPSRAALIDRDGVIIASGSQTSDEASRTSIYEGDYGSKLKEAADVILSGTDGITSIGSGQNAAYIAYANIDNTDWILCIASPVSAVIRPAAVIHESIDENTTQVANSVTNGAKIIVKNCLLLFVAIILATVLGCSKLAQYISKPLKKLEKDVVEISQGNFDRRTDVETNDEIGNLAHAFNYMTESLQQYMIDLKEVTAKEERIASELSLATEIQANMLPRIFPPFPDRKEFEIYATMTPAKEVGGDFYDFFFIDDEHLALVMADVSGKGVPAALFMVIAKTLIKNRALMGGSPAQILGDVNEQLCEGNQAELFVTVWLGILEISTGKGIAANAGHEHPVIKRKGGDYELVIYKHSPAVATMEGIRFREHEFELHSGDTLYVYTDGVPESTDNKKEMFGTDRMLEVLNKNKDAQICDLLREVKNAIDEFAGGAEQFDDITMLGLTYFGEEDGNE